MPEDRGWIGFDLDGTLAVYDHWRGPDHIGEPIEPMVTLARELHDSGWEIRIFTARASVPDQTRAVWAWAREHLGFDVVVTCVKDFRMVRLYDDRAVEVVTNLGVRPSDLLASSDAGPLAMLRRVLRRTPECPICRGTGRHTVTCPAGAMAGEDEQDTLGCEASILAGDRP